MLLKGVEEGGVPTPCTPLDLPLGFCLMTTHLWNWGVCLREVTD